MAQKKVDIITIDDDDDEDEDDDDDDNRNGPISAILNLIFTTCMYSISM